MRQTLNLGSFFTTGTDEVRQWTIRKGTKAPAAAGVIHGDFEKTFIQAVVYNYDVLKDYGNEADVKAAGKVLTKGKDYEMVSFPPPFFFGLPHCESLRGRKKREADMFYY